MVDTGVDYGHPDLSTALRYWSGSYKGDNIREPLVFDADQSQVLLLQPVSLVNSTHIHVGGRYYETLLPWSIYIYLPYDYYRVPAVVNSIISSSNDLRFGVTYMFVPGLGTVVAGVLVIRGSRVGHDYFSHAIVDANMNCNFEDDYMASLPFAQTKRVDAGRLFEVSPE